MSSAKEKTKAAHSPKKTGRRANQAANELPATVKVQADFAACGRCSYFWAGYRVIAGEEGVETAVSKAVDGWLTLPWNQAMSELVHKSYGVLIDMDFFHYEGSCPECRRAFTCVAASEWETETAVTPEPVLQAQLPEAVDATPVPSQEPEGTSEAGAGPTAEPTIDEAETSAAEEPLAGGRAFRFHIQLLRQNLPRRS